MAVTQQTYSDPSLLPEAFTWNMTRYDYYATGPDAEQLPAGSRDIVVTWDPTYQNSSGSYGRLTIENFYKHSRTKVCDLTFDNTNTHNFEWNGDVCTFSLNSYNYASDVNSTGTANATLHYAFINSAIYKANGSTYWIKPDYVESNTPYPKTNYQYGGNTELSFTLDISKKSITINNAAWGAFMCKSSSGAAPSYVLDYYTRSDFVCTDTDLVDIIRDKNEGDEVTVADDLLCVAFLPQYSYDNEGNKTLLRNVLVCKDLGKYANPDVNTAGAFDYMHETGVFQREYDQSNWVVLTSDEFTSTSIPGTYLNHIIKGGTIKGTFTDKRNPTIALSQLPTAAAVQTYTPNTYVVPSFNDAYAEQGSDVFFVRPKPQEYCQVMWANYDAATDAFYVPTADDGTNVHNLSGGFAWEKTYLNMGTPTGNTVYTFFAMVNKVAPASESYCVWMHALNWESNLVEDQNNYVYAVMGGKEIFGSWPGKRLSLMRKAYDSAGNATNWYYINLGTEKQEGDLIIFSRNGSNQCEKITNFQLGNNFYNYWMDGYGDRYETLTGFSPTAPAAAGAPRRVATAEPDLSGGISESYVVMPLSLDSSSVLTGISTMRHDAEPVQTLYYSPTGLVSSSAFGGINIVVTRYTDGTTQARKVVIP